MKKYFSPSVAEKSAATPALATNGKDIAGPVANTVMTEEYVKLIAAHVYFWAWPMTNIHNRKTTFEKFLDG
jgi:hypothetical protein